MRPINNFTTSRLIGMGTTLMLLGGAACNNAARMTRAGKQETALTPSTAAQLDPTTIPRFQTNFQRVFSYAPTRNAAGQNEYTVQINKFRGQQLPSGFPQTTLFGYGGNVLTDPAATVGGRDRPEGVQAHLAGAEVRADQGRPGVDPLPQPAHGIAPAGGRSDAGLGEPEQLPEPLPPFVPFPPGYPQAQSPITHTTHTHGIEVVPAFDGTPDMWFTAGGIHGPEFVSNDYTQPSSNQSAAFWYHDHAFGVTRLDVGMGLSGYSILRDPDNALDRLGNSDISGWRTSTSGSAVRRHAGEQHDPQPGRVLGIADEPGHHRAPGAIRSC